MATAIIPPGLCDVSEWITIDRQPVALRWALAEMTGSWQQDSSSRAINLASGGKSKLPKFAKKWNFFKRRSDRLCQKLVGLETQY